ncbi:AAWKG family protein [Streptomyces sp. NPDC057245]|uniref:AAWKG family protein n=1 Tax=Streptomyces TaxID=1883 RepID=UPI001C1E2438|nr:AAWKG family protein [Streptomyces sp. A108]MBU6533103.1 AAWKG family protein [Streptomyces sp. A108]
MAADGEGTDLTGDTWQKAVQMLTGYVLPDRNTVFDTLKGNEAIPLMHVRLDHVGGPSYQSNFLLPDGWHTHNTDYTFPYYAPNNNQTGGSAGDSLHSYRAHITFLAQYKEDWFDGDDWISDYGKTSDNLKDKGGWNWEGDSLSWNTNALVQYVYGSRAALKKLTEAPDYSTRGFVNRGREVTDGEYVNLLSFTEAAQAFDRVVKFFEDSSATVGKWDTENIGEGSDSWDGTSAALFKELVHKLARNYEGYVDQLTAQGDSGSPVTIDGVTVNSAPARALAEAQQVILTQAENLLRAWQAWERESNPGRWLYDMLRDGFSRMFDHHYSKTTIEVSSINEQGNTSKDSTYVAAEEGFKNTIIIAAISQNDDSGMREYGPPASMTTWREIGNEAVKRWNESAQDWLAPAGAEAIAAIRNAFYDLSKAFDAEITDKDSRPLSDIAAEAEAKAEKKKAEEEAAKAKAEADQEKADAEAEQAQQKADYEKEKAEAKAEKEKEKAEAEAEQAAAKAEADQEKAQAKAEQEQEKAQAKAEQEAAKAEADQEKAQAKAEQEQEKAQAKAEQEAAKAEADQEKAQAKADQEQQQAEAEQAAAEQRAFVVAQNQKAQDEADKERERARAEQEAAKAEAEQEKAAAKAEQEKEKAEAEAEEEAAKAEYEKEKAEAEAEQDREKAEAEAEQEAAKAEAEQEKAAAKAEQEQQQAQYEADREAAKQEQDEAQATAQAEQDRARREATVERQQARLEAQQAQEQAQQDYEQQKADAQAEREAAVAEADRQEQEARQEYEQQKADAEEERDQAREQAEQDRTQAREEYDRELAAGADESQARQDYDRRLDEIDAAEREALERADAAEAEARGEYDQAKADAQEDREQARTDAQQARRDARAEYDERMGDVQAEYDRLSAGNKDFDELIRQRIADLPQPPDLSAYNQGGGSPGSAYSSAFGDNLYNQDDLSSALGRPQGSDAAAASAGGSGTGSGSPGMYPPMGRGVGGDAGGNSGERTRTVIEPGVARSARTAATTPTVDEEEHRVAARNAQTSSGSPFMPPMGGMGGAGDRPQTESGDRERTTWLAEDEDVWGTEEGGAPQALGR